MVFQWWWSLRQASSQGGRRARKTKPASQRRYRLTLETLEDRAVPTVTAISLSGGPAPSSVTATGQSTSPAVSGNGRYIAFQSNAIDLVLGQRDPSNTVNIFLYDEVLRTMTLVSHSSSSNTLTANGDSTGPVISGDGRYIVYQSDASDLEAGVSDVAGPNSTNVFVFDRTTGMSTLVSRGNAGGSIVSTGDAASFNPVISADGNFIAFVSNADNLATGGEVDTNGGTDVFLYDQTAGTIALVSRSSTASSPVHTGNDASSNPVINSDGSYVAFQSLATDLVSSLVITPSTSEVFLYSRATQTNTLVSHNSANASKEGNGASTNPTISGDGSLVAYQSAATDLVTGQSNKSVGNVFVYNRAAKTNTLVSSSTSVILLASVTANGVSDQPILSANGQTIVYRSLATDLVFGQQESTGATNVFLYNTSTGTNTLVSRVPASSVTAGDGASGGAVVNANGNTVVFTSTSSNLVSGENKQDGSATDVFIFDVVTGAMRLVSTAYGFTTLTGSAASDQPVISSDATFIAFHSIASNLISGDLNGQADVFGFANHTDDLVALNPATSQLLINVSTGSSFLLQAVAASLPAGGNYAKPLVGDFNGDGLQDLAIRDINTGIWYVALANGSGGFSAPTIWTQWYPGDVWDDVVVGDFDGNGRSEVAGRFRSTGEWWVGQSTGASFVNNRWTIWAVAAPGQLDWVDVMVGDLKGNGLDDIVGRVLETGQWWAAVSMGSSFQNFLWTTWNPGVQWVDVHIGDFTGDGKADIVGRTADADEWWVALSTGSKFNNFRWTTWSSAAIWTNVVIGDFNGDGKMDIAGQVLGTGQWWIALSTGSSFNNLLWLTWPPSATWVDVQAGDFNGDGYTDLAGRDQATGDWLVGISNGSSLFNSTLWTTWSPSVAWTGVGHGAFV